MKKGLTIIRALCVDFCLAVSLLLLFPVLVIFVGIGEALDFVVDDFKGMSCVRRLIQTSKDK